MKDQADMLLEAITEKMANGWAYGTHPRDKAKIIMEVIKTFPQREAMIVDSALMNAAEILANFKGEPDSTKLEEWQACYAKLFTQMSEIVAMKRGSDTLVEFAEQLYNLRRDLRHKRERREVYGQYLTWAAITPGEKNDWIEIAQFAITRGARL